VEIETETAGAAARLALCGVCSLGADDPDAQRCTRTDCGLRPKQRETI
jgi:hypothetical protein